MARVEVNSAVSTAEGHAGGEGTPRHFSIPNTRKEMKYIDAKKLIKSVKNYQEGAKAALNPIDGNADYYKGKIDACEDIQEFITYLQQEQPEVVLDYKKMLELLLESISYAYSMTDGTYGSLSPVVSDKVRYIEKQLRELALKRMEESL